MKHYLFLLILLCSATTHISCADKTAPKVINMDFNITVCDLANYQTIANLIERKQDDSQALEVYFNDLVENPLIQTILLTLITAHGIHNPESAESMLQLLPKRSPLYLPLLGRIATNYSKQNKFTEALDLIHTSECIMMESCLMINAINNNIQLNNLHAAIYWLEKYNTIDPLGENDQKALDGLYENIPSITIIPKEDGNHKFLFHNPKAPFLSILKFDDQDLYNPAILESRDDEI